MPVQRQKSANKRVTRKTMRCSPVVDGKTATDQTCYTNDILLKLREAYHKNHPDQPPIATTQPAQIHRELKRRLHATCPATEDCWLKELPTAQRQYIDKRIFAPDQPDEWSNNPQEWLSNFDIEEVLHQYEVSHPHFLFIGPTPIDFDTKIEADKGTCVWNDLCNFDLAECVRRGKTHVGIIFNLDTHDQDGSHWVSMFICVPTKRVYYFDSAANPTPPEIQKFVQRLQRQSAQIDAKSDDRRPVDFGRNAGEPTEEGRRSFNYDENFPNQHQRSNTECGMYSLYFIITMLKTLQPTATWSRKFKRGKIPDRTMIQLRNVYYNIPQVKHSSAPVKRGGHTRQSQRRRSRRCSRRSSRSSQRRIGGDTSEPPIRPKVGLSQTGRPLGMIPERSVGIDWRRGMRAKVTMGVRRSLLDYMDKQQFKEKNTDETKTYTSRVTPHIGYANINYTHGTFSDEMDGIDEALAQILYGKTHSKPMLESREYVHFMDVPGLSK